MKRHSLPSRVTVRPPNWHPPMDDLQTRFEEAADAAQHLDERPDNATLLQLYALYKQATAGDVQGKRPGFTDFAGRAKYDA